LANGRVHFCPLPLAHTPIFFAVGITGEAWNEPSYYQHDEVLPTLPLLLPRRQSTTTCAGEELKMTNGWFVTWWAGSGFLLIALGIIGLFKTPYREFSENLIAVGGFLAASSILFIPLFF
jgi:hypothetical protein